MRATGRLFRRFVALSLFETGLLLRDARWARARSFRADCFGRDVRGRKIKGELTTPHPSAELTPSPPNKGEGYYGTCAGGK